MGLRSRVLAIAAGAAALASFPLSVTAQVPLPPSLPGCLTSVTPTCIPLSDVLVAAGTATTTPAVQLTGGGGTFNASSAACAYLSDADVNNISVPVLDEAGQCSLSGIAGNYTNVVCGTGTATGGTGNWSSSPIVGEAEGSGTFTFNISFYGGVGITVGTISTSSETEPFVGVTLIGPGQPQTPPGCTAGFTFVTADVVLEGLLAS